MPSVPPLQRAAFLDRDGVINLDRGYVYRREDFEFVAGAMQACVRLHRQGFVLVVVTNQAGIGRGLYGEDDFQRLTGWMRGEFASAGAPLAGVYHCPHHPTDALGDLRRVCDCRKPAPGMLLAAIRDHGLDPARSVLFGDKISDIEAAAAAGVAQRVLLGRDGVMTPAADLAPQASARFASLAEAVASPWFEAMVKESADA